MAPKCCRLCDKIFQHWSSKNEFKDVCYSFMKMIQRMSRLSDDRNKRLDPEKPGECFMCRKFDEGNLDAVNRNGIFGSICEECYHGSVIHLKFLNLDGMFSIKLL